jgi:two-component system sensor histidine kinase PilS (NtrC family)
LAAVGELSASIAHEVRNPLAAISGSIQILRDQFDAKAANADRRHLMDIVLRETDRLNRLITDFLRYARPGPAVFESVEIAGVVEDVTKMFEATRPANVRVVVRIPSGVRVVADAS